MNTRARKKIPLYLRVLGYRKSRNLWAAHCLETDLVGYGKSFEAALDSLLELTRMQINFAFFKDQPALLYRPASPDIFETYNNLLQAKLERYWEKDSINSRREITAIPWPVNLSNTEFSFAQM